MNEIPESNLEHTALGGRESLNHKEVFCVRSFCSSTRDREKGTRGVDTETIGPICKTTYVTNESLLDSVLF